MIKIFNKNERQIRQKSDRKLFASKHWTRMIRSICFHDTVFETNVKRTLWTKWNGLGWRTRETESCCRCWGNQLEFQRQLHRQFQHWTATSVPASPVQPARLSSPSRGYLAWSSLSNTSARTCCRSERSWKYLEVASRRDSVWRFQGPATNETVHSNRTRKKSFPRILRRLHWNTKSIQMRKPLRVSQRLNLKPQKQAILHLISFRRPRM